MASLLQRAEEIRNHLKNIASSKNPDDGLEGVSEEEREEIFGQINEMISKNRIKIDDEVLSFTPIKNGSFLPVLINIVALIVLVGGYFLFSFIYNQNQNSIVRPTETVASAEGKLIAVLREESERQLEERDKQISDIQKSLQSTKAAQEKLKAETEAEFSKKEADLKEQLAKELEAEKGRLSAQGLSSDALDEKLKEFAQEKQTEYTSQLDALTAKLNAEREAKEKEMASRISAFEDTLNKAREDKKALEADVSRKQAELEQQYQEKTAALNQEKTAALKQLEEIGKVQEQGKLVMDQVLSMYDRTNGFIKKADYQGALTSLDNLESFLKKDSVATVPEIRQRRNIESFIISSLRNLIDQKMAGTSAAPVLTLDNGQEVTVSEVMDSVNSLVEQGNQLYTQGEYDKAQEYYLQAMNKIPTLETGFSRLKEIEDLAAKAEREKLDKIIAEGATSYAKKDYSDSLKKYEKALEYLKVNSSRAGDIVNQIMDSGYRIGSSKDPNRVSSEDLALLKTAKKEVDVRGKLLEELSGIKERYAASGPASQGEDSQETLIALLNTKLLVKQILVSDAVRKEHPDLYEEMEKYFETYGEEKKKEGQDAALKQIIAITNSLKDDSASPEATPLTGKDQRELIIEILDNLKALLEEQ